MKNYRKRGESEFFFILIIFIIAMVAIFSNFSEVDMSKYQKVADIRRTAKSKELIECIDLAIKDHYLSREEYNQILRKSQDEEKQLEIEKMFHNGDTDAKK